jgi:hypothetical protein
VKNSANRLVNLLFAFVAVFIVWQVNPPAQLDKLAQAIGAQKNSILYDILQNGGVPLLLTLAAAVTLEFYQRAIWPILPSSHHKGGWWLYGLVAETGNGRLPVAGYFRINHTQTETSIPEGRSFYIEGNELIHRGDWRAEAIWHDADRLRFVFTMHATANPREPLPSQYEGFLALDKTSDRPLCGTSAWCGYFHDLGDRRTILGPVVAEHISASEVSSVAEIQNRLRQHSANLIRFAETRLRC